MYRHIATSIHIYIGCIVSHLVAATLERRGEAVPWRLSVLFNGMRVRDESYRAMFDERLKVPALMVFGTEDEFYGYGKHQALPAACARLEASDDGC